MSFVKPPTIAQMPSRLYSLNIRKKKLIFFLHILFLFLGIILLYIFFFNKGDLNPSSLKFM